MKRLSLIMLIILFSFSIIRAENRNISCTVTTNSNYTSGENTMLEFSISIASGYYADFFNITFPEGFTINSGSSMGTENASISGNTIEWGEMSGWTGSGMGNLYGSYTVNISVNTAASVSGNQTLQIEMMSDDPSEADVYNGTVILEQQISGPVISVSTNKIYFEEVDINAEMNKTFSITNIGIDQLQITNISSSNPDFTVTSDYSNTLSADETIEINVKFTPTVNNYFQGQLNIESNGGVNQVIDIHGIGKKSTDIVESFENGFPPTGWYDVEDDWTVASDLPFNGNQYAKLNYYDNGILSTPKLTITNGDRITFFAGNRYVSLGEIKTYISTNRTDWTEIFSTPAIKGYHAYSIDLSSFDGSFYIGFSKTEDRILMLDQIVIPQIDMNGVVPEIITLNTPDNNALDIEPNTTLQWTADGFATGYYLSLGTNETADNIINNQDVSYITTYSPTLDWDTQYFWKVQGYNENGEGQASEIYTFTTQANPIHSVPFNEDFTAFLPAFWTKAKGQLSPNVTFTDETSNWTNDGFANIEDTGSARVNIYGTTRFEWLISPTIDLGTTGDLGLSLDIAFTTFSGTNSAPIPEDDIIAIIISTDNGNTWSENNILREWRSTDTISNTGETINIDLSAYSGLVKIGFYGESTISNGDNNLYIDNINVLPMGDAPTLRITPQSYTFSEIMNSTISSAQAFELAKLGNGVIRIDNIQLTDNTNFILENLPESYPVEISTTTLTFNAIYTPQSAGEHQAIIEITTNAGIYEANLNGSAYTPLQGDLINNPISITLDETGFYTTTASNESMHNDYFLPGTDGKDVIYKLSLNNNATVDISLEGSAFNTKLAVYAVNTDPQWVPNDENYLYYNDNDTETGANWSALYNLELTTGEYYIIVDSYSNSQGNYTLTIEADIVSEDAVINVTPENYDFTEMIIGNSTDYKTFLVSNGGETAFTIQNFNIDNNQDFEINPISSLPQTITDNTFGLTIRFTPQSSGEKTATITLNTTAGEKTFNVTGTALNEGMIWESFENEDFPSSGWTRIDNDGDENNWRPWSGTYARTGDKFTMSNSTSMWGDEYDPDNWLITPKLSVRNGDKLIWYVRPMNPEIPGDLYEVKLSTTGITSSDFTIQLFTETVTPEIWAQREVDLSDYAGQEIYIAFHHIDNIADTYAFAIDDIFMPPFAETVTPEAVTLNFPEDDTDYIYGMTSLSWNPAAYATRYKLSLGTDNPPTNIFNNENIGNQTLKTIYDLAPQTTYYWQITPYNNTGDAINTHIWNFTTADFDEYTIPYANDFSDCTAMPFFPAGWTDYNGLIGEENTIFEVNTYMGWVTSNFANLTADNKSLAIEIYGDEVNNWAISPTIDLGNNEDQNHQVRFDMAYTKTNNSDPGTWGTDDRIALVISTDNGHTWKKSNILEIWNQNNPVSNIGQPCSVDLTGYSGQIRLAFYAESTDHEGSGKIFIDNLFVGEQINEPMINVLPNNYNFPLTQTAHLSEAKTFRVSNIGIDILTVNSISLSGQDANHFTIVDPNIYPAEITTNQITFNVIFYPTSAGQKTANITIVDQNGEHNYEVSGYSYGTNGDTIEDPVIVEFNNGIYTTYGSTTNFNNNYTMPYEYEPQDSKDVVYKMTFENDVTVHAGISQCSWDTQMAVYPADVIPNQDNWLYYNDDSEEMRYTRSYHNQERQTRGYNSIITHMHLPAGSYFLIIDGSTKTGWFDDHGDYRLDIQAFSYVAPTDLTITENNGNAELSWNAPNIIDGELDGYLVIRNNIAISATINSTSFIDYNVIAGYDYNYHILAVYDNLTGVSSPSNTVNFSYGTPAEDYLNDSFEDYNDFDINFTPWTLHNLDGANNYAIEGFEWENMAEPYAFMIFNPTNTSPSLAHEALTARTGDKYAVHFASEEVENNDWLISRELILGSESSFSFYAKTFTTAYGAEKFRVAVSTTDTNPTSFNYIDTNIYNAIDDWHQYIFDLSAFDHESIYIAIQVIGTDGFIFMIDDFNVKSNNGGVDNDDVVVIYQTELNGNYPNPFNPTTNISFSLAKDTNVKLNIYNIKGQKVKTLINKKINAGQHVIVWDGKDSHNNQAASGVYFYRFETDNYKKINKMMLIK
ncbi:MAG: choice-of-anchor J domain-containing protein [Candidatus Cloacimonetes bacterium]|nr:choice-of-anchor J domain-containing protein [Candidatus Cloacimonadota bacterium]